MGWVLLLGVVSIGCAHRQSGQSPEPNVVVQYLTQAERQSETDGQEREIRRALEDLMTLPAAELRQRRYADYGLRANQWTLPTLLMRYFVSQELRFLEEEEVYRDAQAPVAKEVVRQHIKAIDEGRQVFKMP